MWIKNTSKYPTDEVRRIVKFAAESRGIDVRRVEVHVKGSKYSDAGRAYPHIPAVAQWICHRDARYLIVLRVGKAELFPVMNRRYRRSSSAEFPVYNLLNWREALVHLASHELTHILQFQKRTSLSEIQAERAGVVTLREWRMAQEAVAV